MRIRYVIQNNAGQYLARFGGSGQYTLQDAYAENCAMSSLHEVVDAILYELKNSGCKQDFRVTKYDMSQPTARPLGIVDGRRLLILLSRHLVTDRKLSESHVALLTFLKPRILFREKRKSKAVP
jgi:hypothetical protein